MTAPTIADTGPIVALIDRRDFYHSWAKAQFDEVPYPLLVCEAVLTEACHLVQQTPRGREAVLDLIAQDVLTVAFRLGDHAASVRALIARYANVPMSLADACLVRMAEIYPAARVLTLDRDFLIYRKNGREPVPAVLPEDRV